jgi:hypothetical protein
MNIRTPGYDVSGGSRRCVVSLQVKRRPLKHLEVELVRTVFRMRWLVLSLLTVPLGAQEKAREAHTVPAIPLSALPPAGLCRVWLKDVPAGQQPAPTECATAIRHRPPTALVLFGDSHADSSRSQNPGSLKRNSALRSNDALQGASASQRALIPGSPSGARAAHGTESAPATRSPTIGAGGTIRPVEPPPPPKKPLGSERS